MMKLNYIMNIQNAHALLQDYYGWPSWVIYTIFAVGVLCLGILLGFVYRFILILFNLNLIFGIQGCLQIFDYCLGSFSKDDTNTVPEDIDELVRKHKNESKDFFFVILLGILG